MVSSTFCPTVHILGSQNVYSRAEGIADYYWPWAVFSCMRSHQLCSYWDKSTLMSTIRALKPNGKTQSLSAQSLDSLVRKTFNSLKGCRADEADVAKVSEMCMRAHLFARART